MAIINGILKNSILNGKKQRIIAGLLGVIALAGGYYVYEGSRSSGKSSKIQNAPYRNAPDFELPDAQGKIHRLDELKGSISIIHFWASWCAPCLEEIPQWVELASHFQGRSLKLVAISLDRSWADAHKILPNEKLKGDILSLLDLSGKVPDAFGTFQFPETYLISPDLKILTKWVGSQDWNGPEMRSFIESLLKAQKH